jgi:hypothetical protein
MLGSQTRATTPLKGGNERMNWLVGTTVVSALCTALSVWAVASFAISNRDVLSSKAAGRVEAIERETRQSATLAPAVDFKGRASVVSVDEIETRTFVRTDRGSWVVDAGLALGKGTTLRLETRRSGRSYLCRDDAATRSCWRVLQVSLTRHPDN